MDYNTGGNSSASYTVIRGSESIAEVRDNSVWEGSGDGDDRDEWR